MKKSTVLFITPPSSLPSEPKRGVSSSNESKKFHQRSNNDHPFQHRGVNTSRHIGCIKTEWNFTFAPEVQATHTKEVAPPRETNSADIRRAWENWALGNLSVGTSLFIKERFGTSEGTGREGGGGVGVSDFARRKSRHLFVIRDTDSRDPRVVAEV